MTIRLNGSGTMYPKQTVELSGLSTDTKPTGDAAKDIATGSTFLEVDTCEVFFYDEQNDIWHSA